MPQDSSAWSTLPSSPSYTASSVNPRASVSTLIAAFASSYRIVGKIVGTPPVPAIGLTLSCLTRTRSM
ncbi:hypothetical protein ACIOFQ_32585 [[Kitasatospora] papulosa]|uniref:hypothetical protein n=1 Tax=[Kitasatospora] papulosa TaxID=1464011 RepID=UPI0038290DD9